MIFTRSIYATRRRSMYAGNGAVATSRAISFPSSASPFVLSRFRMTTGRMGVWWLVGLMLIWGALLLTTVPAAAQSVVPAAAQSFKIYVPSVTTDGSAFAEGEPPAKCGLNEQEEAIATMMLTHPDQQRDKSACDPILAQVARAHARDMALRDYFSHVNPDGIGPNLLVRQAGYPLPNWYGNDQGSNNIESISGGQNSAEEAWQAWLNSSSHRIHILGSEDFYAQQDAYGVGYYFNADSTYGHYWVFISSPLAEE